MSEAEQRQFLRSLFDAAVGRVAAAGCLPQHLPPPPKGRTVVVSVGKGAAAMAATVEVNWPGPLEGIAITRYGHGAPTKVLKVVEAAHPVPDAAGQAAAREAITLARSLGPDDLLLALISGGGSSLLTAPAPGLKLADKQAITDQLLRCGATIHEINAVRRHLSAIKGGRLAAAAAPAKVVTLAISDVPGDDPAVIASGPTVPDPSTFADARAVLEKYGIEAPPAIARHLKVGADETPKPGDPRLANAETHIVATAQDALQAAAEAARAAGVTPVVLGDSVEGESRDVALVHAAIARQVAAYGEPAKPPAVLLSGGETTVTVRGKGRGGRNAEFLLALAVALKGAPGISAIACDTDGIDGSEDNAGAILTPTSLERAGAIGHDAARHLANNDGYGFFEALGDLVVTGPTLTNVNDFRAILIA